MPINITVIVPIYNVAKLLYRCLDSVFNQEGNFSLEVIAVDDGSTDNSLDLLQLYPKKLTILTQSNQGPAATRNKGIKAATGKYLAFLDADDYWKPEFLKETVSFLENNSEAVAVSTGQLHKIPGKQDTVMPKILKEDPLEFEKPIVLNDFYDFWATHKHVCTGSVLMRAHEIKQTGGQRPELRITEDLEFWAYLATFGQWGFIPKVLFVSDGGVVTRKQGWLEKNKKRWASAPTPDKWAERIEKRIPSSLANSFSKMKGIIAKNLSYSMLLSGSSDTAKEVVQQFGSQFPSDNLSKLMFWSSKFPWTWNVLCKFLKIREYHRQL